MKSLLYKIFGAGKLREPFLSELYGEGIIALEEGVKSTITYKNFRAPGRYSNWKRRWIAGGLALTEKRLVLLQYSVPVISLALDDERLTKMNILCETRDTLLFTFEPALFLENSTGKIEWRFRTVNAQLFVEAISRKMPVNS